jgi:hypothetical protein
MAALTVMRATSVSVFLAAITSPGKQGRPTILPPEAPRAG